MSKLYMKILKPEIFLLKKNDAPLLFVLKVP